MAAVWGKYEQNVLWYEQEGYMFCFAYKWLGERTTHAVSLSDFKGYKKQPRDDKLLISALDELRAKADVVIYHNGDQFDDKVANGRTIVNGLLPPEPYRTVDTLKVARKHFKLNSNKLDDLGRVLGVGRKERTGGIDLWYDVYHGDPKAIKKMVSYNKQDVVLLEKVYLKLRPWITNHPNLALMGSKPDTCPNCGLGPMQKRGIGYTASNLYQRVVCKNCNSQHRFRVPEKGAKTLYV